MELGGRTLAVRDFNNRDRVMKIVRHPVAMLTALLSAVAGTASPAMAGQFYGNYRTSYAPSYYSTPSEGGWATYYFGGPQYSGSQNYAMNSGYGWTGNSCNSCQTASYAVSSCDGCSPCGNACSGGCSDGSCGNNCPNGNCANGNCTTNLAPSGTPTPIADPNPPRPNPTAPRNDPPSTYEPIPSRPPYTPPARNTFEDPSRTPMPPRSNELPPTRPAPERDGFTPRNNGSEAPMFDPADGSAPMSPNRSTVPMGRDLMIDPMSREPFTPSGTRGGAGSGTEAPAGGASTPMPPIRRPAPTSEPAGSSTEFGGSFRPNYEAGATEAGKNSEVKTDKPAQPADAEKPAADKPGAGDSSMKIPAPTDFTPVSPADNPSARPLNLDQKFVTASILTRERKSVNVTRTLPALVRTVVRPQNEWERNLAPQMSLAASTTQR
ncbi:MAG: hypothetical protein C0478_09540 [Planctomyces sp.]|nr:hypothetical protein [Planctomyces sp.]